MGEKQISKREKGLSKLAKSESKDFKEVLRRIKKKDFSGNTGLALKNSLYQFATTLVAKIGSLFFMMVLARLLMPELFGLYSLALSTLILFISFTDLGLEQGMILFLSRALAKKDDSKAKAYLKYLSKIKLFLTLIMISALLFLSKFLADTYYQKPIFIALVVGMLYVFVRSFVSFFKSLFFSFNNFKKPFTWELTFQILRIILVPLAVIFFLDVMVADSSKIYIVILALSLAWILTTILILYSFFSSVNFIRARPRKITPEDKKQMRRVILPLSAITLSGIFFGYIDMLVLGRFASSEFIGFYQVAFSLSTAIAALLTFSVVLLPIFSRMKGTRFRIALSKALKNNGLLAIVAVIVTFFLAPFLIKITFGGDYSDATILLRILALIIFALPLNSIYASSLISQGRTKVFAKLLILTTIINISLNYGVAFSLKEFGHMAITIGICLTTIFSKYLYLLTLFIVSRKNKS